jgi:Predicted AAA-ATPase
MKNLPIGIQSLSQLRDMNCVYVDKTQLIHKLVTTGSYYFLSRPRRFGKSLLISTLKALFLGHKALFEGLWIEDKWDWSKTNPVIHISFDAVDYQGLGLEKAIQRELTRCAKDYSLNLEETTLKSQFQELIEALSAKYGKVVLLIDEYDKPLIDYLEDDKLEQAKANRLVLRDFYSVLKSIGDHIQLLFITGISKFSKVSLFSHLNNLRDITIGKHYAALTGYTQEELEFYFDEYIESCQESLEMSREELLEQMKIWYDGYTWDGVTEVYNPCVMHNFLDDQVFNSYWFVLGTPNFLIHQLRKHDLFNVENIIVDSNIFDKDNIEHLGLVSLLFQTGYLTVKELYSTTGDMVLNFPNKDVKESYGHHVNLIKRQVERIMEEVL